MKNTKKKLNGQSKIVKASFSGSNITKYAGLNTVAKYMNRQNIISSISSSFPTVWYNATKFGINQILIAITLASISGISRLCRIAAFSGDGLVKSLLKLDRAINENALSAALKNLGQVGARKLQTVLLTKNSRWLRESRLESITLDAVSKSKFWNETVIFVIEDDPQNGLDHVDGHRTIALCISPYTKRGIVISTHYNQNSILRTIELILGLPPMSQFDLISFPMVDCFTNKPDFTSYKALSNNIPLDEMNPKLSSISGKQLHWAKKSMELKLNYNDDLKFAEEIMLNRILWYSVKGYDVPYPNIDKKSLVSD